MAGDWIKIEHVTIDKPEILAISDELDISPEEAFGHVFRVWVWCDQQSLNGDALSVTKKALDRVAQRDGIATAMENTGWLTQVDGVCCIPNFDRHNGETAKKRALTKKRTQKYRNAASVTEASPEKRREDIKEKNTKKKKNGYTPEFEDAWKAYPKRAGGNPKEGAFSAWRARIRDGVDPAELIGGVERYARFVRATGKEHTEFVKQAKAFFGPEKHFNEKWEAPKQQPKRNGAGTAEDIAREYQQAFGKPPPAGKTTEEVRMLLAQKRDKQQQWWNG